MTTAGRSTFDPAKGGRGKWEGDLSVQSKQYSARDMPSHLKMKYRRDGQGSTNDVAAKNLNRDLEMREGKHSSSHKRNFIDELIPLPPGAPTNTSSTSSAGTAEKRLSASANKALKNETALKKSRLEVNPDADDPQEELKDDEENADSGSENDSNAEDETEDLMAELEKIKRERAAVQSKLEQEKSEQDEKIRMENILKGNPLKNKDQTGTFKMKRRWDDDVVFKNCARGEVDKKERGFINDTLRSEFHKKFMDRYIK